LRLVRRYAVRKEKRSSSAAVKSAEPLSTSTSRQSG
jgi:hypothetical protein